MALGSVEYIIIEFSDSHVRAEIVPELAKLIESETVRIIDLVFVLKDSDGKVSTFEFDQLEELAALGTLAGEVGGFVNSEDIDYAADALEPHDGPDRGYRRDGHGRQWARSPSSTGPSRPAGGSGRFGGASAGTCRRTGKGRRGGRAQAIC